MTEHPPTTDHAPDTAAPARKKRTILVASVTAGVLLLGGGIATAAGVSSYNAETERLCAAAISGHKAAVDGVVSQNKKGATAALDNAQDAAVLKTVPGATAYSKRAEVKADAAKKIEARPAAATLIANVKQGSEKLTKAAKAPSCSTRDDATSIEKNTKALKADATALSDAAGALTKDVTAFAVDEKKRIAAEKAAAAKKAAEAKAKAAAAAQAAGESSYVDPGTGETVQTFPAGDGGGWNGGGGNTGGGGGGWTPPTGGGNGGGGGNTGGGGGGNGGGGGGTAPQPQPCPAPPAGWFPTGGTANGCPTYLPPGGGDTEGW